MSDRDMTLAFDLEAIRQLANPGMAMAEAREWSAHRGIVAEAPTYVVKSFARERAIDLDFFSGPEDRASSLQSIARQFPTDRYVFVGATAEDRTLVAELDWEFQDLAAAADAAGWALVDDDITDGTASTDAPAHDDWP